MRVSGGSRFFGAVVFGASALACTCGVIAQTPPCPFGPAGFPILVVPEYRTSECCIDATSVIIRGGVRVDYCVLHTNLSLVGQSSAYGLVATATAAPYGPFLCTGGGQPGGGTASSHAIQPDQPYVHAVTDSVVWKAVGEAQLQAGPEFGFVSSGVQNFIHSEHDRKFDQYNCLIDEGFPFAIATATAAASAVTSAAYQVANPDLPTTLDAFIGVSARVRVEIYVDPAPTGCHTPPVPGHNCTPPSGNPNPPAGQMPTSPISILSVDIPMTISNGSGQTQGLFVQGVIAITGDGDITRLGVFADPAFGASDPDGDLIDAGVNLVFHPTIPNPTGIAVHTTHDNFAGATADMDRNGTTCWTDRLAFINSIGSAIGSAGYSARADLNLSGKINDDDYALYVAQFDLTACRGDYNCDGALTPSDVAAFINAWNGSTLAGDFDGDGDIAPADVAGFIGAWYAGC